MLKSRIVLERKEHKQKKKQGRHQSKNPIKTPARKKKRHNLAVTSTYTLHNPNMSLFFHTHQMQKDNSKASKKKSLIQNILPSKATQKKSEYPI